MFTIPKAIRGLFERERRLLGLLPRCALEALEKSFQAVLGRQVIGLTPWSWTNRVRSSCLIVVGPARAAVDHQPVC